MTRSHKENRKLICACCGVRKTNCLDLSVKRNILEIYIEKINPSYDVQNIAMPTGVCQQCKVRLYEISKGKKINDYKYAEMLYNSEILKSLKRYRNNESCSCQLCTIGSLKGRKAYYLRGELNQDIEKKEIVEKRCPNCLSILHKGVTHKCSRKEMINNFIKMINQRDDSRLLEQVVSSGLKSISKKKEIQRGEEMTISTFGKSLSVTVGKSNLAEPKQLKSDSVFNMKR